MPAYPVFVSSDGKNGKVLLCEYSSCAPSDTAVDMKDESGGTKGGCSNDVITAYGPTSVRWSLKYQSITPASLASAVGVLMCLILSVIIIITIVWFIDKRYN